MAKTTEIAFEVIERILQGYPEIKNNLAWDSTVGSVGHIAAKLGEYTKHHKWLVNEKIPYEITIDQAFFSWYENVYIPQYSAMKSSGIFSVFPTKASHDLFDEVSTIKYELDEVFPKFVVTYEDACNWAICFRSGKLLRALLLSMFQLRRFFKDAANRKDFITN